MDGFVFSPVVGGVGVGGCAVGVGLRRVHRHVVFRHTATNTHGALPVHAGRH